MRKHRLGAVNRRLTGGRGGKVLTEVCGAYSSVFAVDPNRDRRRGRGARPRLQRLVEKGLGVELTGATRNRGGLDGRPRATGHVRLYRVQTGVELRQKLAILLHAVGVRRGRQGSIVRRDDTGRMGRWREQNPRQIGRKDALATCTLGSLLLPWCPLGRQRDGLTNRRGHILLELRREEVRDRPLERIRSSIQVRQLQQSVPRRVVRNQLQHRLHRLWVEFVERYQHLDEDIALSLAAAHVACVERQQKGIHRILRPRRCDQLRYQRR